MFESMRHVLNASHQVLLKHCWVERSVEGKMQVHIIDYTVDGYIQIILMLLMKPTRQKDFV